MDLVALRPQALLPDLGFGLCRRLHALRCCPDSPTNGRFSSASGRRRRGNDPLLAGNPDGDFSARGAATGDGGVGDGADGGAHFGSDAGRMDHRQLELALEFLHQRADRNDRDCDGVSVRSRPALPGRTQGPQGRLRGHAPAGRGPGADANRGRSRRARRLVQFAMGGLRHRGLGPGVCRAHRPGIDFQRTDPRPRDPQAANLQRLASCCRSR
jgi:hypothetical protein